MYMEPKTIFSSSIANKRDFFMIQSQKVIFLWDPGLDTRFFEINIQKASHFYRTNLIFSPVYEKIKGANGYYYKSIEKYSDKITVDEYEQLIRFFPDYNRPKEVENLQELEKWGSFIGFLSFLDTSGSMLRKASPSMEQIPKEACMTMTLTNSIWTP